jgi:lauroyl/myristoyl acyltransferase
MFAQSNIALSGWMIAGASVAILLGAAAVLSVRELMGRRKWGEKLLGALRVLSLFTAAILVLVPAIPNWLVVSTVPIGLWLAGRPLRKFVTIGLLRIGALLARRTDRQGVERLRRLGHSALRATLPLRYRIVRNMRRAGVYHEELENEHLERAGDQMEFLMHILRAGYPDSGVGERFCFDQSLSNLHQAHEAGRGVLVLSPHLCGYPVFPRVLAEHVPTSIYLRRSPDPSKHALNVLMGQAGGGDLVFPPPNGSPAQRLSVAIGVLRKRRALYVTPDLPRKANEGVPVTVWSRTVHFSTGVMVMAMRTGSPAVIATWFFHDGRYYVRFGEPMEISRRGDRQHHAHKAMLAFARATDEHLHEHPEMWWNWLDKRWTRILRRRADSQNTRAMMLGKDGAAAV